MCLFTIDLLTGFVVFISRNSLPKTLTSLSYRTTWGVLRKMAKNPLSLTAVNYTKQRWIINIIHRRKLWRAHASKRIVPRHWEELFNNIWPIRATLYLIGSGNSLCWSIRVVLKAALVNGGEKHINGGKVFLVVGQIQNPLSLLLFSAPSLYEACLQHL